MTWTEQILFTSWKDCFQHTNYSIAKYWLASNRFVVMTANLITRIYVWDTQLDVHCKDNFYYLKDPQYLKILLTFGIYSCIFLSLMLNIIMQEQLFLSDLLKWWSCVIPHFFLKPTAPFAQSCVTMAKQTPNYHSALGGCRGCQLVGRDCGRT